MLIHRSSRIGKAVKMVLAIALTGVLLSVAGLVLLSLGSPPPTGIGVRNGVLAGCEDTPNCVSSSASSPANRMPPLAFDGDPTVAMQILRNVIADMDGANLVSVKDGYIYCEFTTPLFRFVDDAQFLLDREQSVIQFRSASRIGYSDLGLNRRRMTQIREKFAQVSAAPQFLQALSESLLPALRLIRCDGLIPHREDSFSRTGHRLSIAEFSGMRALLLKATPGCGFASGQTPAPD
jgi:uncharacterized protein (DUF1499 family)